MASCSEADLELAAPERSTWLHLNLADSRAGAGSNTPTFPSAPRRCCSARRRTHVEGLADGLVAALGDLHHDFKDDPEGLGSVSLYGDARRFVSGRRHPLRTMDLLRRDMRDAPVVDTPFMLFARYVERLAESFGTVVVGAADEVDDSEDAILSGRSLDQGRALGGISGSWRGYGATSTPIATSWGSSRCGSPAP